MTERRRHVVLNIDEHYPCKCLLHRASKVMGNSSPETCSFETQAPCEIPESGICTLSLLVSSCSNTLHEPKSSTPVAMQWVVTVYAK